MKQTECLTEWQIRIRNATSPSELLQVADEMRVKSEEARRKWMAEVFGVKPHAAGRRRTARSDRRSSGER